MVEVPTLEEAERVNVLAEKMILQMLCNPSLTANTMPLDNIFQLAAEVIQKQDQLREHAASLEDEGDTIVSESDEPSVPEFSNSGPLTKEEEDFISNNMNTPPRQTTQQSGW